MRKFINIVEGNDPDQEPQFKLTHNSNGSILAFDVKPQFVGAVSETLDNFMYARHPIEYRETKKLSGSSFIVTGDIESLNRVIRVLKRAPTGVITSPKTALSSLKTRLQGLIAKTEE